MIVPVLAGNPGAMTGRGNWTYIITGKVPVLIDAGVGREDHVDAIASHLPSGPAHVIVTHAHEDHALGAERLAARWPGARFWKWPWPERDLKYPVSWNYVADGQRLDAGDDQVEVVHTPGHSPDHICLWQPSSRVLFGGDLLVLGSTVVVPASSGGNLVAYLESLSRVDALGAGRVLPAHGDPIDDPHGLIRAYVDHRLERERQVLAAVREGKSTVEQIAAGIYVGLPSALERMARESVLAHLLKLEAEGAVRREGANWFIAR